MPAKKSRASKKDSEKTKKKRTSKKGGAKKAAPKKKITRKKNHKAIKEAVQKIPELIVEEATKQYTPPPPPPKQPRHHGHIMSDDAMRYTEQKKKLLFIGVTTLMLFILGMWGLNAWALIAKTTGESRSIERKLYDLAKEDFSDTLTALRVADETRAQLEKSEQQQEEQTTVNQIKRLLTEEFENIAATIASSPSTTINTIATSTEATATSSPLTKE